MPGGIECSASLPEGLLRVARLENGPPVGFPVQFRVLGSDPAQIREIAYRVRDAMRAKGYDPTSAWRAETRSSDSTSPASAAVPITTAVDPSRSRSVCTSRITFV